MADVCMFLEGTYPYVSGGVSSCVHQLISKLPNLTFSLIYLGSRSEEFLTPKYDLPKNVVGLKEIYLFDPIENSGMGTVMLTPEESEALKLLHYALHRSKEEPLARTSDTGLALNILFPNYEVGSKILRNLSSLTFWDLLVKEYREIGEHLPFVEFFYSWRTAHIPLYRVLSEKYPPASVYHALCTGYAGVAGAQASRQNKSPLILTEHGIYAHEREMEISEADWIYAENVSSFSQMATAQSLKQWYIQSFKNMSRFAYNFSSQIVTLFEANRVRQIEDGAKKSRTRVIPNGVSDAFDQLRRKNPSWKGPEKSKGPFIIGFVGRIVPIKDVKTLIKAVRATKDGFENIKVLLIGPSDEDPQYYKECLELIDFLDLKSSIHLMGPKKMIEVYPNIDCLLLTSISEAQPLVILEANASGIPCVATDVGGCREMLEGGETNDRLIGKSGLLASIGDDEGIASKLLEIIYSETLWEKMSLAGIQRVDTYYKEDNLISQYDVLYRESASGQTINLSSDSGEVEWQE